VKLRVQAKYRTAMEHDRLDIPGDGACAVNCMIVAA
jgi:hypothetical protein